MAKLCRYNEAIEYYSKGYKLQPNPKYIDSLIAISHIYEISGNYDKATEKLKEIIVLSAYLSANTLETNYCIFDLLTNILCDSWKLLQNKNCKQKFLPIPRKSQI